MIKGHRFTAPILPASILERALESLPWSVRVPLARTYLMTRLLHVSVVGQK